MTVIARRVLHAMVLAPIAALVTGCCARPSGPWDRPAFAWRSSSPGVVVIVDRAKNLAVCTGTVLRSDPAGEGFRSYVLTAGHCVADDDHPRRWGVVAPGPRDTHLPLAAGWLPLYGVPIVEATRVLVSPGPETTPAGPGRDRPTVDWIDDWSILAVDTTVAMPVLPLFSGDPAVALEPGAPVSLVAYHDGAFRGRYGEDFLQAHEHPFAWTGVPQGVAQSGHSGAPIVHDGQVVAILSGYTVNSYACRLLCASTWQTRLRLVSIETIRREAAAQGLSI